MTDITTTTILPGWQFAAAVLAIGARVEGGDTEEDYDTGRVVAVDGDQVTVAWQSGTRTTQHFSLLRPAT